MKIIFTGGKIWALGLALLFGFAHRGSSQITVVSNLPTLQTALQSSPLITNFGTNVTINLTTVGETLQISQNVTIDAGTNFVLFEGNNVTRLFNVRAGARLTLRNLQLHGGVSTNGGAIYSAGTLVISNCVLYGNSATNASGVNGVNNDDSSGDGSSATSGLSAAGAAIYSRGPVTILYSILTNNTVSAGSGGNGGNGASTGFVFGGNGGNGGSGGSAAGAALY
ncbi:MAG TPA: hypothetical protein VFC44_18785, partial [Candidatus Saccharimonadales bacterium]|nr:hypothetical protein [Candidatus Saccharimonadales bacterium]